MKGETVIREKSKGCARSRNRRDVRVSEGSVDNGTVGKMLSHSSGGRLEDMMEVE